MHCSVARLALLACLCLAVGTVLPAPWRLAPSWLPKGGGGCSDGDGFGCYGGPLVPVDLFGEALCPNTTTFIDRTLAPLFQNGIASLMKLRYIPFGHATLTAGGVECQNGPAECRAHRYLLCSARLHPSNASDWFEYVRCVQGRPRAKIGQFASAICPRKRGWDPKDLTACAEGVVGFNLEKQAGRITAQHRVTRVPWVLINRMPIQDQKHLGKYICAAYTGSRPRPAACFESQSTELDYTTRPHLELEQE